MRKYFVNVFGKQGCAKCDLMKKRLAVLLERPEYRLFELRYYDIRTDPGIVAFCNADCVNPNRIPALLISGVRNGTDAYLQDPRQFEDITDAAFESGTTYQHIGLQTDYDNGGGVVTPAMLQGVLDKALLHYPPDVSAAC